METPTAPRRRVLRFLATVFWFPACFLLLGALTLPLYFTLFCPTTPDPTTGHVIRLAGRGSSVYLIKFELILESGLALGGFGLFVPLYSLRSRLKMLPESVTGPDYDAIRATYHDN